MIFKQVACDSTRDTVSSEDDVLTEGSEVRLVPVRFLLDRFPEERHLLVLDANEVPEDEATQWSHVRVAVSSRLW